MTGILLQAGGSAVQGKYIIDLPSPSFGAEAKV
jgi:hypothetical protein